uniref:Uncharacterized protein n=1 Tax=Tanacetum cinerariifolium TaxID=118510 RepID=A0A699GMP4_TANCI|nr:hypothetical protein [Tanacetum cinerariifolium]
MNPIAAQQVALDNALVSPENRVQIDKYNIRIDPTKTLKEPTYQVVLDSLALSHLYPAFLITSEVSEIYMHQFWHTITKIENSSSYKFKLDKKKCTIDVKVFRNILQICLRLPNQEFDAPPSDEKIATFIKELRHKGVSTKGADLQSKDPDEPKDKSIDTSEGTGLKLRVPDVSKADSSKSEYESVDLNKTDDEKEDEFVHTSDDYVPIDDENVDDEEFERINKEMYSNVNVELKESEREGKEKDDEEMNDVGRIEAEHENVNQEVACDQVKDDAQATVTATPAIQNTKVPLQSSYISSKYSTKFLNFDNIPSRDTEIISMMDVKVQHKDPSIQTSPFLTVLVLVILETSSAQVTIIPSPISPFTPLQQQSTPIPTSITTEATTSTTAIFDSTTLSAIHQRLSDLESKVKTLKNINHSLALHATIRSKVLTIVKKYLETNIDDALHKPKSTGKSAQAEGTMFEAGDTQRPHNLKEDMDNANEPPIVNANPNDWSYDKLDYNMEECYKAQTNQLDWNNPEGDRYPFDLSIPLPLQFYKFMEGDFPRLHLHDIKDMLILVVQNKLFNLKVAEKRLMKSLEKYVGGREYGEDLRLL